MNPKKTLILYDIEHEKVLQDLLEIIEQILKGEGHEVIRILVSRQKKGHEYLEELKKLDADYLISIAMAGFSWTTLASQVAYNLLYAKQIHILVGDYENYEEFLKKEYAMNLFFFTDHPKWFQNWEEKYPGIPYLEKIPTLYIGKNLSVAEKQADNKIMKQVINKVIDMAEGR